MVMNTANHAVAMIMRFVLPEARRKMRLMYIRLMQSVKITALFG